jgi:hypothetical protein
MHRTKQNTPEKWNPWQSLISTVKNEDSSTSQLRYQKEKEAISILRSNDNNNGIQFFQYRREFEQYPQNDSNQEPSTPLTAVLLFNPKRFALLKEQLEEDELLRAEQQISYLRAWMSEFYHNDSGQHFYGCGFRHIMRHHFNPKEMTTPVSQAELLLYLENKRRNRHATTNYQVQPNTNEILDSHRKEFSETIKFHQERTRLQAELLQKITLHNALNRKEDIQKKLNKLFILHDNCKTKREKNKPPQYIHSQKKRKLILQRLNDYNAYLESLDKSPDRQAQAFSKLQNKTSIEPKLGYAVATLTLSLTCLSIDIALCVPAVYGFLATAVCAALPFVSPLVAGIGCFAIGMLLSHELLKFAKRLRAKAIPKNNKFNRAHDEFTQTLKVPAAQSTATSANHLNHDEPRACYHPI